MSLKYSSDLNEWQEQAQNHHVLSERCILIRKKGFILIRFGTGKELWRGLLEQSKARKYSAMIDTYTRDKNGLDLEYSLWATHK